MWLTAEQAKPMLELVPGSAIWRPTNLWAYEIIRSMVDQGEEARSCRGDGHRAGAVVQSGDRSG